ncbi:endoribonuclease YbeY [Spirochaetia bacterium]|nr:endoribonuclease YbeY [Spirochaetia bacterium]GHU31104.1 endoribonuclease YbeY [Spirochaetia bacterium]
MSVMLEPDSEAAWTGSVAEFVERILDYLHKERWDLSVLFCTEAFIRNLNAQFRSKDEATDVLSFPFGEWIKENGEDYFLAGDIVIALPVVEQNAADFGVSLREEVCRLLIHGVLHLDGADHTTNDPSEPMLMVQETILAALGDSISIKTKE